MRIALPVAIWLLVSAVWLVRGTRLQAELADARFRREQREAARSYQAISELMAEVPRWRLIRRRRQRREIEAVIRDDPELWPRYLERRKDLAAWNLLESAAALAFGAASLQIVGLIFFD